MAYIFLSYRRSDSAQACRVYEALAQRFGRHAVFMDVADIPVAVQYPERIKGEIGKSKVMVALIGPEWQKKMERGDDPVRWELEAALAGKVAIVPALIGNTAMPDAEALPESVRTIATQNAITVGVSQDFQAHAQMLVRRIEGMLAGMGKESELNWVAIAKAMQVIVDRLTERHLRENPGFAARFVVANATDFTNDDYFKGTAAALYLHRIVRLADVVEMHFIVTLWTDYYRTQDELAGWTMHALEDGELWRPEESEPGEAGQRWGLRIRASDEDARQVWKMITERPLRLSLSYVATVEAE